MKTMKIDSLDSSSILIHTAPLSQAQDAEIFESKTNSKTSMRKFRSESAVLESKIRAQLDHEFPSIESLFDAKTQFSGSNPTSYDSAKEYDLFLNYHQKMKQFLYASQTHEQLGQLELALEDVLQALEFLDQIAQKHKSTFENHSGFIRSYNHFTLRKGAILLGLGKKEEAVQVLLNHPPKDVATILLYRFIEQKFHVQLLSVTDPVQEPDEQNYVERAESLFLAGHYEEAELLLKEKSYGVFLRCACLTMLGRIEEARELREKELIIDPYFDQGTPEHVLFQILLGIPDQSWENIVSWQNWEWMYQFPIITFWTYADKI